MYSSLYKALRSWALSSATRSLDCSMSSSLCGPGRVTPLWEKRPAQSSSLQARAALMDCRK